MPHYRVVIDDAETIYDGRSLVQALESYADCRQTLPRGDENAKVIQVGWTQGQDRVIAEFVGWRQVVRRGWGSRSEASTPPGGVASPGHIS